MPLKYQCKMEHPTAPSNFGHISRSCQPLKAPARKGQGGLALTSDYLAEKSGLSSSFLCGPKGATSENKKVRVLFKSPLKATDIEQHV